MTPDLRPRRSLVRAFGVCIALAGVVAGGHTALAAPGHTPPSSSSTSTGNDISWPQCGRSFPSGQAFGIVGVDDGIANKLNPCLGPYPSSTSSYTSSELYWAVATSSARSTQPRASLYVNTADPGNIYNGAPVADWPSAGTTPDGTCSTTTVTTSSGTYTVGQNSTACAWEYGYARGAQDGQWLTAEANLVNAQVANAVSNQPSSYPWWLDVETGNTWQSGTQGLAMNVADLQGMVAGLDSQGAGTSTSPVGVYSTSYQWGVITGTPSNAFTGVPDWIPGANKLSGAESNCRLAAFTPGGAVVLTQWSGQTFDGDYAC